MILLVNGPNLNLLGEREPSVYGTTTLADIEAMVRDVCTSYGIALEAMQSNHEGGILDFLQAHRHEAQGVIVNAGALTHTSHALHDCLKAMPCPAVEVHISNVHAREEWRRSDLVAPATRGQIVGLGATGYYLAALWLCSEIAGSQADVAQGAPVETEEQAEEMPAPSGRGEYE